MRFSSAAATALAVAPAMVSASGMMGFSLGTKEASGACKTQQDYESDFDAISSSTGGQAKIVRGYAASDCNFAQNAMPAAKNKGFQVILGIWPDVEESFNDDLNAIKGVASTYQDNIYGVTVGSETLYRGNFTGEQLKDKMLTVKSALPSGIKLGTADSWNKYADGTADPLIGTADMLLINAFAFWQGSAGDNATHTFFDDYYQAVAHITKIAGGADKAPVTWVGETGWPTATGTNYEAAQGGLDNAKNFYQKGYCGILDWGFNAFYFEAFDEPWKPASIGADGKPADETSWGAMKADRSAKFSLKC